MMVTVVASISSRCDSNPETVAISAFTVGVIWAIIISALAFPLYYLWKLTVLRSLNQRLRDLQLRYAQVNLDARTLTGIIRERIENIITLLTQEAQLAYDVKRREQLLRYRKINFTVTNIRVGKLINDSTILKAAFQGRVGLDDVSGVPLWLSLGKMSLNTHAPSISELRALLKILPSPLPDDFGQYANPGILRNLEDDVHLQQIDFDIGIRLPQLMPFCIKTTGSRQNADYANYTLRTLAILAMSKLPQWPGSILMIDPGLGKNCGPLLNLADVDPKIIHGKAWCDERDIENQLREVVVRLENVVQKHLRDRFTSMLEYNNVACDEAQPYSYLIIFDFPSGFGVGAFVALRKILENASKCGLQVFVHWDSSISSSSRDWKPEDLISYCEILDVDKRRFRSYLPDFQPEITLVNSLASSKEQEAVQQICTKLVASRAEAVTYSRFRNRAQLGEMWVQCSDGGMKIPIGLAGDQILQFELNSDELAHAVVAGRNGSGKTVLLHSIITSLAHRYSPEEVEMYLLDFKGGLAFKSYATERLPHAKVIGIATEGDRDFGLSVLQAISKEKVRRIEIMRSLGFEKLDTYRKARKKDPSIGVNLPRILLLIDEYHKLVGGDDTDESGRQAYQILEDLARQGRALGIHLVLASQNPTHGAMSRKIVPEISTRIALQCDSGIAQLMLPGSDSIGLLNRSGEFVLNRNLGKKGQDDIGRGPLIEETTLRDEIRRIRIHADRHGFEANEAVVFESDKAVPIGNIKVLSEWPSDLAARVGSFAVGVPMSLDPLLVLRLTRRAGSHVALCGGTPQSALTSFALILWSLLRADLDATVSVLHWEPSGEPECDYLDGFEQSGGGRLKVAWATPVLSETVKAFAYELEKRKEQRLKGKTQVLALFGVQSTRELCQDYNVKSSGSLVEQVRMLLREGADYGIHVVVWSDTYKHLISAMSREMVPELGFRIALEMDLEGTRGFLEDSMSIKEPATSAKGYVRNQSGNVVRVRLTSSDSPRWFLDRSSESE